MSYLMFGGDIIPLNKRINNLAELLNEISQNYSSQIKQASFRLFGFVIDKNEVELLDQNDFELVNQSQEDLYFNCQICPDGPHCLPDSNSEEFDKLSEYDNMTFEEEIKVEQTPQQSQQHESQKTWSDWIFNFFNPFTSTPTSTNDFIQTAIGKKQSVRISQYSTAKYPSAHRGVVLKNVKQLKDNFCPYPPAKCPGVINGTCRRQHRTQDQLNLCMYSAGKCPDVRSGSCRKQHRPSDEKFQNNVCLFLASECPEVQNGTCRKKHNQVSFQETFCEFSAVNCPDVLNGTCRNKHRKIPIDEGNLCIYPVSQCREIYNGVCRKQHKAQIPSIQVNTCKYTSKTCPDLRNKVCTKLHLKENQIEKSAICKFSIDECPGLLNTGICGKLHQDICKLSLKKCRAQMKGQCNKQHKEIEEEEDVIRIFQIKSKFNIFTTQLPTKPFQTVFQEFQQKFKHVNFVRQQLGTLDDINDITETVQTVELSGQQSKVDKVLIQLTERVNNLDVETLSCEDAQIAKKIELDYKKNIQQQFTISMILRASQKLFVITGDKNGVQLAKKEIIQCIDLIRTCSLNEELVPLPGAPNKALSDLLNKNSKMIEKLKIIYQITEIKIDQNRIRFMASQSQRQAAHDVFQEFIIDTLEKSEILYMLTDKDKVKFAKKFQNQLTLKAKGTKLEFVKQVLDKKQESGFVDKLVFEEQEQKPAPYSWAYEIDENDGNYNQRIDKNFDWFFYDWDQNEQIEAFYNTVSANPDLWINGYKMPKQVVGDMLLVRNGFFYEIYCQSNVDANSHTFSADQQSTRFRQKNISVEPFRVRRIARFDRPCHNQKPKQASLVVLDKKVENNFEDDSVHTQVLKLTGLRDSIQNLIDELNTLYADKTNHKMSMTLSRNPSAKEFQMIKAYIEKNFEAEVRFAKNDNVAELQITGLNQGLIKQWVVSYLLEFLQKDFPEEWEDSLEQFCSKTTLKIHEVNQSSKLWNEIQNQFNEKKPKASSKILSIQVIQNIDLWSVYQQEIRNLQNRDKKSPLVLRLWHGTGTNPPAEVFKKDGLNIAYSKDSGYWGRGIYFAVNANYSCPDYSFKVPGETDVYEVFSANAVVGNYIDTGLTRLPNIKQPPLIPGGTDLHYDAIKGHSDGSDLFIVYKNVKTYPGLLVKYQL